MKALKRAWEWFKRNWKWVVFPVGLLSTIITILAAAWGAERHVTPTPDLDEEARKALTRLRQAELDRDVKVAELEIAHKERLETLSEDQKEELKELKDKPLEEVVAWFDQL